MSLFPNTDFRAWTRHDVGSFTKRYFEPLWRSAMRDFRSIDANRAQDLAQSFLLRELERTPVFERYEPLKGHSAKFRSYLRTCFFRFSRDELEKESRRRGVSLENLPADLGAEAFQEFDRLVARDYLKILREKIVAAPPMAEEEQRYFDLKWPADINEDPASDADIAQELSLPRGKLRTIKKKVVGRILLAIRQGVRDDGLRGGEADGVLEGYLAILGDEDA